MITQEIIDKVEQYLLNTGGMHAVVPTIDNSFTKFNYNELLPYRNAIMVMLEASKIPYSAEEFLENYADCILIYIELLVILSFTKGKSLKAEQFKIVEIEYDPSHNDVCRQLDKMLLNWYGLIGDDEHVMSGFIGLCRKRMVDVITAQSKAGVILVNEVIESILNTTIDSKLSIFYTDFFAAQYDAVRDYLKNFMDLEPTTGNAEAYLPYKDVEEDKNGEVKVLRYYGEIIKEDGNPFIEIVLYPKTGALPGKPVKYHIRLGKKEDKTIYTLMRIHEKSNSAIVIDGPFYKPVKIIL